MASEEVIEEVEALTAILEEDTVEVVKEEGGERPKVRRQKCENEEYVDGTEILPGTEHQDPSPDRGGAGETVCVSQLGCLLA